MRYSELINENLELQLIELPYDGTMYNEIEFRDAIQNELIGKMQYHVKRYDSINNGEPIAELHLGVHPNHQRQGYAQEMISMFVHEFGYPAYFHFGRITNDGVHKVIKKLSKEDPSVNVETSTLDNGYSYYLITTN